MNIQYNTTILSELFQKHSDNADAIVNRFPKINKWINEEATPTYNQLVELSNIFNIPFGYLFLEKLPIKEYPIPHYRTLTDTPFKPSDDLLEVIETLKQRQNWAKDILTEFREPLPFANSITIRTSIEVAAQRVRDVLELEVNWTILENITNWKDAFRLLISRAETAGIFVVASGIVGNNTHRKLDVREFRGFVLYDGDAPFIFINGNDFITGKIFTIIHEIVHVLIGKSASFDFANLEPANNRIEGFCNAVTAEFLVPKNILLDEFRVTGNNYNLLAKKFMVSRIVIARRLLDLGKITKREFNTAYNNFRVSATEIQAKGNGGDFFNTSPYRISREFFKLIYNSVKHNKVLYRDAFRLTGLKAGSFDGYVNEYFNNRA